MMSHIGRPLRAAAFWFATLLLNLICCRVDALPFSDTEPHPRGATQPQSVRSIALPHFEPDLAVAPGRDAYLAVCVSCHSPRYVSMQPFFPQRQWEETVDKMVKVYGAQMDPEQRQSIITYLVSTHGPNSKIPSVHDDEFETVSSASLPVVSDTAPVLKIAADPTEHATEIRRGADLFKQNCAACHGSAGRGDGFVSQVLLRKPKNLAAARFSVSLLSQVLWDGKRGTAMPSWRTLPKSDLAALAAYVQTLHPHAEPDAAAPEELQQGNKIFQLNCAPCHGASGDGKGLTGANLMPEPASFKLKQPDIEYVLEVLRDGIQGTAMPSWKDQISESDRRALAVFVRSIYSTSD